MSLARCVLSTWVLCFLSSPSVQYARVAGVFSACCVSLPWVLYYVSSPWVQYSRVGGVVFCGSVSCGGLSSRLCCCLDILSVGIVSIMLGYVFYASELEEEPSYVSFMAWYNGLRLCRPSCHSDRKPESLGNASEMEEDPSHVSCISARCNCLCLCRPSRHCDRKQPHRYCN